MSEPNPALVTEPDAPVQRTYRVAKTAQRVLGHRAGSTFTATLDPDQERLLLAGGALQIVDSRAASQPETAPDSSPDKPGRKPTTAPKE